MNIIFPLISILKKFSSFLKIDGYGASEMAKLIGCLQAVEPGKHPKNADPDRFINMPILGMDRHPNCRYVGSIRKHKFEPDSSSSYHTKI
jgi:hypothetical protein